MSSDNKLIKIGKEPLKEINYKILYEVMKKHELSRMEKDVLIGNEPKIPVILNMKILPNEVYEHRMRKSNKFAGRKDSVPAKDSSSFHCLT